MSRSCHNLNSVSGFPFLCRGANMRDQVVLTFSRLPEHSDRAEQGARRGSAVAEATLHPSPALPVFWSCCFYTFHLLCWGLVATAEKASLPSFSKTTCFSHLPPMVRGFIAHSSQLTHCGCNVYGAGVGLGSWTPHVSLASCQQ